MDRFTKDLTKNLLSNGDVKELFRQQLETAINHILQAELTAYLVMILMTTVALILAILVMASIIV